MRPGAMGSVGGGVRGGWGWGLEVCVGGGGGWGLGVAGCVRYGGGGWGLGWGHTSIGSHCRSREEEWDQEPTGCVGGGGGVGVGVGSVERVGCVGVGVGGGGGAMTPGARGPWGRELGP